MSLITHLISYRDLNHQKTLILSERAIKGIISDTITPITDLSNVELQIMMLKKKVLESAINLEEVKRLSPQVITGKYDV